MGAIMTTDGFQPAVSHDAARELLEYLHVGNPIVLLIVFVTSFVVSSVRSAKRLATNGSTVTTGPGGRPLPKRTRSTMVVTKESRSFSPRTQSLFKWLNVVILVTFVADAAITMTHVIVYRAQHWWCGQSFVVSISGRNPHPEVRSNVCPDLHCRLILHLRCHSHLPTRYKTSTNICAAGAMGSGNTA